MKYIAAIIFFGVMIISLGSCKKENAANNTGNSTSLIGSWELQTVSGSIPALNYPAGNGNTFEFTASTYKKYTNKLLAKSGNYKIVADGSAEANVGLIIKAGQFTNRIIFDNDTTSNKIFFEIQDNKLTMLSGFFPVDGGSSVVYVRK